jgi:hypothetical protein
MFGNKSGLSAGKSARQIKGWARELLAPGEAATIIVSELRCTEPGCPPVETVIAVLRGPGDTRQFKIHRPSAEVTREDVESLARAGSVA